jgi:hypothetical protein
VRESELLYDWRFTANRSPLRLRTSKFIFQLRLRSLCNVLSDERMGLTFTIAAGPRQSSHSQVRVPRDSWPYFTVSDSRLPQPGGPGPPVYISPRNRVARLYVQTLAWDEREYCADEPFKYLILFIEWHINRQNNNSNNKQWTSYLEDWGSKFLRNVRKYVPDVTSHEIRSIF